MKFKQVFLLLLSLSFCCSAQTAATNSSPSSITLTGKEWKLRFKDENANSKLLEYMTNNESVNKWTRLFTLQKFNYKFPHDLTPITFANKEVQSLKDQGVKYDFATIESSPQEAIIEIRISSPTDKQQDEIQRIIKTPNDQLILLQYAVRHSDMGQEERTKLVNELKQMKLPDL